MNGFVTMPADDFDPGEAPPERFDDAPAQPAPAKLPLVWLRDFGELHRPPPLRWLLTDLRTRKPFLRAGECFVLAADGGTGKGYCVLELAVSVALGLDLFGVFRPEQRGRVAVLFAEDQKVEVHHRLHRIANSLGLGADEIEQLRDRLAVLPLAGTQVRFMGQDPSDRNPTRLPAFEALVQQLAEEAKAGGFEWSLIVFDPLARFGAANVETDQLAATAFVQALESMAERLPGHPAIGCSQHSSAASTAAGRSNVRGVTGLRNAFRAALILDAIETKDGLRGVRLTNDKNNLAPKAPPLWLIRQDNEPLGDGTWLETAGVLRRATDEEAAELDATIGHSTHTSKADREKAKTQERADKFADTLDAVVGCLPSQPDGLNQQELLAALSAQGRACSHHTLAVWLAKLMADGRVVDLGEGTRAKSHKYARTG